MSGSKGKKNNMNATEDNLHHVKACTRVMKGTSCIVCYMMLLLFFNHIAAWFASIVLFEQGNKL